MVSYSWYQLLSSVFSYLCIILKWFGDLISDDLSFIQGIFFNDWCSSILYQAVFHRPFTPSPVASTGTSEVSSSSLGLSRGTSWQTTASYRWRSRWSSALLVLVRQWWLRKSVLLNENQRTLLLLIQILSSHEDKGQNPFFIELGRSIDSQGS